ncbi:MAG: heparinase II/III family protein, partial [Vicinamibacterales bacterium]
GQLFPICGRPSGNCADTLATASAVLGEPALAIGPVPEETYWMCGSAAQAAISHGGTRWASTALTASGYFVSRTTRGDHLIFDAGPHGYLNGGHAHADALSCTLEVAGRALLIDPGTATYTMDPEVRDRFRGTRMHNTLMLDGRPQSEPRGAFHWRSAASSEARICRSLSDCDYAEGAHDAYAPRRHVRGVLAIHGLGWWVLDHILGQGTAAIESNWHLHPSWRCTVAGPHVIALQSGPAALALASSVPIGLLAPGTDPLAMWSPAYGAIEPSPVIRASTLAPLPASLAIFIPAARELADKLAMAPSQIDVAPGAAWHGCAFRVRWKGGAMTILSAVERSGGIERIAAAPSERWGTAELQTDARVAVVIDYSSGPSEAILVDGAFVGARPAHSLVSLSRRVPLLRLPSSSLASSMHEVGSQTGSPQDT